MNKSVIVVISVLILVSLSLIEGGSRYRHRYRHRSGEENLSKSYEVSGSNSVKPCINCNITNIANGHDIYNKLNFGSKSKSKEENTDAERRHHHSHIYESDESDENIPNDYSCKNCIITNIGNGKHIENIINFR